MKHVDQNPGCASERGKAGRHILGDQITVPHSSSQVTGKARGEGQEMADPYTAAGCGDQLTLERSDSGDSSMCSSSELSISSSMPVIFPARFECMVWMSGNKRSPGERDLIKAQADS